jgi:uncharacterized protein YegJ (DUF2314 family)
MDKNHASMYKAVIRGEAGTVKKLIRRDRAVLDGVVANNTWLHLAARKGDLAVMEALVGAGLPVDQLTRDGASTPLESAAGFGRVQACEWLLDHCADINRGLGKSATPIFSAIYGKSLDLVKLFVERGADLGAGFGDPRRDVLSYAATYGTPEILAYLRGRLPAEGMEQPSSKQDTVTAADSHKAVHTPGILWLEEEDPEMRKAIREAQRTFKKHWKKLQPQARRAALAFDGAGVKVFFPSPKDPRAGEHMWVKDVVIGDQSMTGTLCDDPGWLTGLSEGDRVSFSVDRVSDWFYVVKGVAHGGFTVKVVLKNLTPAELAKYRDTSPICYFVPHAHTS